jgi:hypothetical protein
MAMLKRYGFRVALIAAVLLSPLALQSNAQDLTSLLSKFLYEGTLERALLFSPDNTYDIGASGANRPRSIFAGTEIAAGSHITNAAAGFYRWGSLSRMYAPSDGVIELTNNAANDFSRLQFGGTTSSFPALKRNGANLEVKLADDSAFSGISGNVITATSRIDITGTTFASLGTPSNGALRYCSDCTIANPCASGGTGAFAKRLNSTWVCN